MRPGRTGKARTIVAMAAVAGAFVGLLVASGGCELAVGDTLPAYECDPASDSCPSNEVCDPATHECVESCAASGCRNGAQCNSTTGLCSPIEAGSPDSYVVDAPMTTDVVQEPEAMPVEAEASMPESGGTDADLCGASSGRPIGCGCGGPGNCASLVCGDQETVTTSLYDAAGMTSFCTQPCCTSSDCPDGSVCFATAAGGNYCALPQWLGRGTPGTSGIGGTPCGTSRDCRSGLCGTNGLCADTCCSTSQTSSECASGTTCAFSAFPGMSFDTHYAPNCGTLSGTGNNDSDCFDEDNAKCKSELCFNDFCSNACRSGADCSSSDRCTYLEPDTNGDLGTGCVDASGNDIATGQTCDPSNDQCATGFCDSAPGNPSGTCVDVCFTNSDCTGGDVCLPSIIAFYVNGSASGNYTVLACGSGS